MAGGYITEIRENEVITDYNQNGTWTNLNNWHIDASQVRTVFDSRTPTKLFISSQS